jgi:hypothetical protein
MITHHIILEIDLHNPVGRSTHDRAGDNISQTQLLGNNILMTNSAGGTPGETSARHSVGIPAGETCQHKPARGRQSLDLLRKEDTIHRHLCRGTQL